MDYSIELHQKGGKDARTQMRGFDVHICHGMEATDYAGAGIRPAVPRVLQAAATLGNKYNEINLCDVPEQPGNSLVMGPMVGRSRAALFPISHPFTDSKLLVVPEASSLFSNVWRAHWAAFHSF